MPDNEFLQSTVYLKFWANIDFLVRVLLLRAVKLKQRQSHEKLTSGKSLALHPGQKYYLVPSSWLSEWRAYITATGKNISSLPEPQSLEVTINSLICEKVILTLSWFKVNACYAHSQLLWYTCLIDVRIHGKLLILFTSSGVQWNFVKILFVY